MFTGEDLTLLFRSRQQKEGRECVRGSPRDLPSPYHQSSTLRWTGGSSRGQARPGSVVGDPSRVDSRKTSVGSEWEPLLDTRKEEKKTVVPLKKRRHPSKFHLGRVGEVDKGVRGSPCRGVDVEGRTTGLERSCGTTLRTDSEV